MTIRPQRTTGGVSPRTTPCTTRSPEATDQRFDDLRRRCPQCGDLGIRIVYGYPSAALVRAAMRGKLVLGGCTHGEPTHRCAQGHEWHSPDAAW